MAALCAVCKKFFLSCIFCTFIGLSSAFYAVLEKKYIYTYICDLIYGKLTSIYKSYLNILLTVKNLNDKKILSNFEDEFNFLQSMLATAARIRYVCSEK